MPFLPPTSLDKYVHIASANLVILAVIFQITMEWDGSLRKATQHLVFRCFFIIHLSNKSIINHNIQKVAIHTKGHLKE